MKKIFTLVALFAGMATAAFAASGGGFVWAGTGATYDATQKALILDNAKLTSLTVAEASNSASTYGTTYTIIVKGTNTVTPTTKIDGLTVGNASFTSTPTLKIIGEGENPNLTLNGQLNAGLYMRSGGYLDLENINLTCNGKLNTAAYGISGYSSDKEFVLRLRTNVKLTLDGKTSQWKYLYNIALQNTTVSVIEPAGATLNKAYDNNFIILNGENYNGKTTLATGSGIKIGGVEVDYSNGDNFTNTVQSGKVTFKDGVLRLENATVTGDVSAISSAVFMEIVGDNYIQNNVAVGSITLNGKENGTLTINGEVSVSGKMTINDVQFRNIAENSTMAGNYSGENPTVTINNGSSFYAEAKNYVIAKKYVTAPTNYTIDEGTTSGGKKYIYARYVEDYGIELNYSFTINSENYNDPVGNGTVSYDPENNRLTLRDASLSNITIERDLEIYSEGKNRIIHTSNNGMAVNGSSDCNSLVFTGPGSLDIVTQNNLIAVYLNGRNTHVQVKNTTLNISASSSAIEGAGSGWDASVTIDNSNVTLQSGVAGLLSYVNAFTLERAEFTAPADADFFQGKLCVNYQPIAANTKVEIKALAEGIENIELTKEANKVLVDGVIYIVRDGKLFNLQGAQVK